MACTPLKGQFSVTNKEVFLEPSKYQYIQAGIAQNVLMLLSMAAGDQPEPINQSKVSAVSLVF